MRNPIVQLGLVILAVVVSGLAAEAGGPCHGCRDTAGGRPYGGTVCGPRVCGPAHESVGPIDQCDACARFAGCDGYRQMPEWLAPWQLPPGRGFQSPEAVGYRPEPCSECAACASRGGWPRFW